MPDPLLLAHAANTWFLVGLIWVIQLVHYPSFALVGAAEFGAFHREHLRRISWIVMPLMCLELAGALAWPLLWAAAEQRMLAWINLLLLLGIWLATALWAVPLHRRLEQGADANAAARLVRANWPRTALWSARGLVLLAVLCR
jgi:hypothetical protein